MHEMKTSSPSLRTAARAGVAFAFLAYVSGAAATDYTVTNTADSGPGSLRQAITDANNNAGPDMIVFEIPGSDPSYDSLAGVWVIHPATGLPVLLDHGTTIDGRTQTAFAGDTNPFGPEIRIEGPDWPDSGLEIHSNGNHVFDLNIDDCGGTAVLLYGANNWVAGCYIGTDPTGSSVIVGNHSAGVGILRGRAHNNTIGTNGDRIADDMEGNIISGNGIGVSLAGERLREDDPDGYYSGRPRGNRIAGNIIGLDRTGTTALGNGWHGVVINGATETVVGTNGDGVGEAQERNVIAASYDSDVMIRHQLNDPADLGGDGNVIAGNYIGTDVTGTIALPRPDHPACSGVIIMMRSKFNRIEGNVISGHTGGNPSWGVAIFGTGTEENTVRANFIGTDASGTAALGNAYEGATISQGARNTRVEGNLISGNLGSGISINGDVIDPGGSNSGNSQFLGNLIGTDVAGIHALPNGNIGLQIYNSADNLVRGNVISGNNLEGVAVAGLDASKNMLTANLIGTDVTGTTPLPNGRVSNPFAVSLSNGAHHNVIGTDADGVGDAAEGNVIGGTGGVFLFHENTSANKVAGNFIGTDRIGTLALGHPELPGVVLWGARGNSIGLSGDGVNHAAQGNVIAHNGGEGVVVRVSTASGNSIRGNSIYANGALGIDLSLREDSINGDGPTLNDELDADDGPNRLQNFPVILAASSTRTKMVLEGTLHSTANATFTLDFYANPACDELGYGEGEQYLGWTTVSTGGDGNAAFTATLSVAAAPGWIITATATDSDGNTSEFSYCSPPVQAGVIEVVIDIKPGSDPNSINLGSNGTVPVAILSSADFDAATVDPTTVRLANATVKLRGKGTPMTALEDVNRDGRPDLVVHVLTSALELALGELEATLTGATFEGTPIEGSDAVRLIE
jgi:titin